MNPFFEIHPYIEALSEKALLLAAPQMAKIDETTEHNTFKVLSAFQKHHVSESHFAPSTGYGYGDRGRDVLDEVLADIFGCEDALIRHNFVSGTHALTTALFGVLRPGDRMVSLTGLPYDTIHSVLGINGKGSGSLRDFGISYEELPLLPDGTPDYANVSIAVKGAKLAYIQRSRGYSLRGSLTVGEIARLVEQVRSSNPHAIIMVDNCYGEFVEKTEPTQVGADLIVGSLIKNPGGGIALTGGYIAGNAHYVDLAAQRLTAPGVGKEVGCSLGQTRNMLLGLFHAPTVVASALKTAVFAASLFSLLGYEVTPHHDELRGDIIQAIKLQTPQALIAFCQGVQKGAPVDAFVTPEPWDMPGYDSKVIMAAGAFTLGASIELSADAPLREPYAAWLQGGLTYPSGKLGVLLAAQSMYEQGVLKTSSI